MATKQKNTHITYWRWGVYFLLIGLMAATVIQQRQAIMDALHVAKTADNIWFPVSVGFFTLSVVCSTIIYRLLSGGRLGFGRTLQVQTAGLFANKLLPAGSGALGVSFLYLRANKYSRQAAGVIVASNNLLGMIGHLLLFGLLVVLAPDAITKLVGDGRRVLILVGIIVAGLSVLAVLLTWTKTRQKILNNLTELRRLLKRSDLLLLALLTSMGLTACYAMSLFAAAQALDTGVTISMAFVALTASVFATAAIPTPGGIGAAEAGVYIGLKAYGIDSDTALAVAILYRFVTFWLPLLVGAIMFWHVSRRHYLQSKL
ncbi:flippase-like domain-containing protein [Candidatus Saccharibacteria bacterium]|nr:flippase-like domain-containing protein [Candidatus Saccharibacteria bacterium]